MAKGDVNMDLGKVRGLAKRLNQLITTFEGLREEFEDMELEIIEILKDMGSGNPSMTFEEFQATRAEVMDLGEHFGDVALEGRPGFVYAGHTFMEEEGVKFLANVEGTAYSYTDRVRLERVLYDFARVEDLL